MTILFSYPSDLVVKSRKTAADFIACIKPGVTVTVPDANDKTVYHEFKRLLLGGLYYGSAHYGPDALLAEPLCLHPINDKEAVYKAYELRKSINQYLHPRED